MVDSITNSLNDVTKIELTGETDPFVIYRGTHPEPGPEGYPWEKSQGELLQNRISVFSGLNRHSEPEQDWCEHYVLEGTNYKKLCDLMFFFDFGMDHFPDSTNQERTLNSNNPEKVLQRRVATQKFLKHFSNAPFSILSLTSDHLIFISDAENSNASDKKILAEAAWNHNNIYYPRPRMITTAESQYSLKQVQRLAMDHSVFSIGWDDA